jgi:pSer/pThr/pTyr-binding forkhead associated (FHA) protein
MERKLLNAAPNPDLTTTISLASLRSVQGSVDQLLSQADRAVLSVLAKLSPEDAMLVALIGPSKGARYLLNSDETSLGRSPDNQIFLDDVTVSRKHALISKTSKIYALKDLGSLNGTYLNGESISSSSLQDGDEVQIGKFRMHFFLGGKERS